jgi:hypothetical protein
MNEWKLATSLTGTLVQIMDRGFDPKSHGISADFYDITTDVSTIKLRAPKDYEGRIIIFRPSISLFEKIDIIRSVDIISLKSEQMLESVKNILMPQGVKIGNTYSIDELTMVGKSQISNRYPYVLLDDSLESILCKMPFLPKNSLYILVESFGIGAEHGVVQTPSKLVIKGDVVGSAMILSDCLKVFELIATNHPICSIVQDYPQIRYLLHPIEDLTEQKGEPYYFDSK